MNKKAKPFVQLIWAILIAAVSFALLFFVVGTQAGFLNVAAQEPTDSESPYPSPDEVLAAFGLSGEGVQALGGLFDLEVVKQANAVSVTSGSLVTYTIVLTNHGPDPISNVFFYDNHPSQMKNIAYAFSAPAISSTTLFPAQTTWLLTDTIPVNGNVYVTVSGILTSAPDVTVQNTAVVTTYFDFYGEQDPGNNSSGASVDIVGSNPSAALILYLPFISKFPPPPEVLAYSENFNGGNGWFEFNDGDCETDNINNYYRVRVDRNENCLPPARDENQPESPYRTYGKFEVTVYDNGNDEDGDTRYGIFINGAGGDNYYLFRLEPNESNCSSGGEWHLIRRKDGNNKTLGSGCHSAINDGYGTSAKNTLAISHKDDNTLTIYINGTLINTFPLVSSDRLSGEGTGMYVEAEDKDVEIIFDDFYVYRFP